ncbi:MAG: hypothetical protein LBD80_02680 [Tannerella sp.]|nr:hypothetical protein [Tannerella sp.]
MLLTNPTYRVTKPSHPANDTVQGICVTPQDLCGTPQDICGTPQSSCGTPQSSRSTPQSSRSTVRRSRIRSLFSFVSSAEKRSVTSVRRGRAPAAKTENRLLRDPPPPLRMDRLMIFF